MAEEKKEFKFPTETVDLPSGGKFYPKDHPLASGKIEVKYMTAKEEDILTSRNLIKKGIVIDRLLSSLIVTENINVLDMLVGDKNAVMVASRILAYGPEYTCEVTNPKTGNIFEHTFNLADCPFKKVSKDIDGNEFEFKLPISKKTITFKILTGKEEKLIDADLKGSAKLGTQISPELTTRLRHTITSVDGDNDKNKISILADNMLARDSMALRNEISRVAPDIELQQEIELEGESVKVDIPMTANFFWPST